MAFALNTSHKPIEYKAISTIATVYPFKQDY